MSHGLDLRLEASLAINAKSGKKKSKKETALAGSNEPAARSARKLYESSLSRLANPCDIKEDEIPCLPTGRPFDIPESWCWCRLGDISTFNGMYVPLPPLAEQKRIVEAIENLLPLCEALKI